MMAELMEKHPLIRRMADGEEVLWVNPGRKGSSPCKMTASDIEDAESRLRRFAPYLQRAYPQTAESGGIIESPLLEVARMKAFLEDEAKAGLKGKLMLKCDNMLPISGSVKARGGIYEVLLLAERIALESGMLHESDDYSALDEERFRKLFSANSIAVGSTGNLGLSIGIMGAQLGFAVTVHMSHDARQWKKDMLRQRGAEVIEYAGDYQKAVFEGRRLAESDSTCHFVDDENSETLFLGYATAASRLRGQLDDRGVAVDNAHPLFVYLPCGVGGAPGGIAFGLKQIYGEDVHCFFAEPVQAPCMLLGVMTGLHDGVSVQDIGLTGRTIADGLAVGKPSKLVGKTVGDMLDGIYTVSDERMERLVAALHACEGIFAEPSATAGFPGAFLAQCRAEYISGFSDEALANSCHIVWATGGGMVPQEERDMHLFALHR